MIANPAEAPPASSAPNRILTLTASFWASSYVLLSIRGAIFHDNWGRLLDNYRLFAVTVGAAAYALVLRRLSTGNRVRLSTALAWIVGTALVAMILRVTIDELSLDMPQGVGLSLLWSLTWSAYFGLWVMGALAFSPVTVAAPRLAIERANPLARPAALDSFELLIEGIVAEASELKAADRNRLAARVMTLGVYVSADGPERDNDRARLALRIAARLSATD